MTTDTARLAQVFVWKGGEAPDLDYARQVLSAVNPETARAIWDDNPPLCLFSVWGDWPQDPWARALTDMRAAPAPEGTEWTDTSRYDLAGWQGSDTRTGDRIFVVTAYRRAPASQPIQGTGAMPPPPVSQAPYYPQYPTGPLAWPPQGQEGSPYQYPQGGSPYLYPYPYDPMMTGPMGPRSLPEAQLALQDSYAPFYVSFGQRITAGLIDFFFMSLLQSLTILSVVLAGQDRQPGDFGEWLLAYGPYIGLAAFIFVLYHVAQWSIWGQTLGMKLAGIKVVSADGNKPGFGRALLRMLGYFFSFSLAGWGFLMIALDPRRQGLHDKIAETFVVPEKPKAPAPPGLPGYGMADPSPPPLASARGGSLPALGMAAVAGQTPYGMVELTPTLGETAGGRAGSVGMSQHLGGGATTQQPGLGRVSQRAVPDADGGASATIPNRDDVTELPVPAPIKPGSVPAASATNADKSRSLFKLGLSEMEQGIHPSLLAYKIEPNAARVAAGAFKEALDLSPNSVLYRYFYAVALRYSEGFEVALREFRAVMELDPSYYETRQQVAYGQRWHDAFAYPAWVSPAPVAAGEALPEPIVALLPPGGTPATRLVLLREGGNKIAAFLSRTPHSAWRMPPNAEMPARLQLRLSRTPHGPIIALYIVVEDNKDDPYIGETFLNPHDLDHPAEDACLLGQHMLEQIARQDRTYLVFTDEDNKLLLSRKLTFDAATQVSIARIRYEVQSLPPGVMTQERFRDAAQWHMQHFTLDQIK